MNARSFTVGVFDSGIGGFSILNELFSHLPHCNFIYYSDDANAPYGPKSDEFITERSRIITEVLLENGADIIVVACNTATAASIDSLRSTFKDVPFVGVEPYLNAYHKINNNQETNISSSIKMGVLTTVSTGKSIRFKKLVERIDPNHKIYHYSLVHLAKNIEDVYHDKLSVNDFKIKLEIELDIIKRESFTHLILGCTHYPLVASTISEITGAQTLSPCKYVALRVEDLLNKIGKIEENNSNIFKYYSSSTQNWVKLNRENFLNKFQQLK